MNEILKYSKNKLLVIAFGNWAYKLIALNWALHLEKLKIENYTVICLDEKLKDFDKLVKENFVETLFFIY